MYTNQFGVFPWLCISRGRLSSAKAGHLNGLLPMKWATDCERVNRRPLLLQGEFPNTCSEYAGCTWETPPRFLTLRAWLLQAARWDRKTNTLRTPNIREELNAYKMSPYAKVPSQPNSLTEVLTHLLRQSGLQDRGHLFIFSFPCQMYGNVKSQVMKKIQVREAAGSEGEGWLVAWQNLGHRGPGEQLKTRRSRICLQI